MSHLIENSISDRVVSGGHMFEGVYIDLSDKSFGVKEFLFDLLRWFPKRKFRWVPVVVILLAGSTET